MNPFSGKQVVRAAITILAVFSVMPAFAHPGDHHAATSLLAGFSHPFSGLDHLLTFAAVGLWATHYRNRAAWQLPLLFLAVMAIGAWVALAGVMVPFAETGIAASVVIFGVLIAFAFRMPAWASGVMLALFALLHGYAHGADLPQDGSAALYGAGFILATGLLQSAGFAFGSGFAGKAARTVGAAMAATGIYLVMVVA